jgi:hypothetical protein
LLDNAVVVVLSDHGESLGLPGDRLLTEAKHMPGLDDPRRVERTRYVTAKATSFDFAHDYGIDTTFGHGTDVLSPSQYHVMLAMRDYSQNGPGQRVTTPVGLIDLSPILLDKLHLAPTSKLDGVAMPTGRTKLGRAFYFEDGFKVGAIVTDKINIGKVLAESFQAYDIDRHTGRVMLKEKMQATVLKDKSFAVLEGDWILSRYPPAPPPLIFTNPALQPKVPMCPRWLLVNTATGNWSGDMTSEFVRHSPYGRLKQRLVGFFGDDMQLKEYQGCKKINR